MNEIEFIPLKIDLLGHGSVTLVNAMASDLMTVNSARCSYGKQKDKLDEKDEKLIKFLAENNHLSTFRHQQFQFLVEVPLFVAVDWYKHVVGIKYCEQPTNDHGWNQFSYRFASPVSMGYWLPDKPRIQSKDHKQSSFDDIEGVLNLSDIEKIKDHHEKSIVLYNELIDSGWAKEIARSILGTAFFTKFMWTCSLQSLVNFIKLRDHPAAQEEIQVCAKALYQLAYPLCPISFDALLCPTKTLS